MHYWFGVVVSLATIGMQTTPSFKRQRRLWNCMLNPEFLENVATPAFETTIQGAIELWKTKSEMAEGSTFAAYEDLRRTTLEGIWKLITGHELGLTTASISHLQEKRLNGPYDSVDTGNIPSKSFPHFFSDFKIIITGLDWVIQGISPRIYKWIFNRLPSFRISMGRMKTMLEGFITQTRREVLTGMPTTRYGLSDALQQKDDTVSDTAIIDEILELLITEHETTASTTAWGLKYLADHQEFQQRLHDSLKQAFPNATMSNLPRGLDICQADIPYLDAVLAEILRMAGTGPVLFRETLMNCEIMGHQVPAKTPVFLATQSSPGPDMISPVTFQVEEEVPIQQKPEKSQTWSARFQHFIPERWLDSDGSFDPNAGLSLPFSTGKRGCFGKRIAMLELKLLIVMFVFSFHFRQLPKSSSKYSSRDSLTRQPACSYVKPVSRHT